MNKNINYLIIIVVSLITLIGVSYSAFTTRVLNNEEGYTMSTHSGVMQINYEGGPAINVSEMVPKNEPFVTKTFTVEGTSSVEEDMRYHLVLVMDSNTFRTGALTYTLSSINTDGNGEVIPSIYIQSLILSGNNDIFLGNGKFSKTNNESKTHTYTLKMYFPLMEGFDHSVDLEKSFTAHIEVRDGHSYCENCLNYKILAEHGGVQNILEAPVEIFQDINEADENSMYKTVDDYGWSYYFRGAKNYVNNNLIFANHQWKIVRINGDGSVRIIYNGNCPGNECDMNDTLSDIEITDLSFNASSNDNKYIGYMYGSESNPTTSYETAHANIINSTIKNYLDSWFENNILNTIYESYLSDSIFCNDREIDNITGYGTGLGYGRNQTGYMPRYRAHAIVTKDPSLKCTSKNDSFTTKDTINGNGKLNRPIGLMSVDEALIAGLIYNKHNLFNYLHSDADFWLSSPSRLYEGHANVWYVSSEGFLGDYPVYYIKGVRGVINLKPNITVTGDGSLNNPYKVI